jgi:predicted enzyme related to lactoylglutathione lyase
MLATLGLVIFAVDDVDIAARFYRDAFAWEETVTTAVYVEMSLPAGMRFGLYDRLGFARNVGEYPLAGPGLTSSEIYIHVDNLDEACARLRRAGARELSPPRARDWGDVVAYFADPDKNVIAVARPIS